MNRRSFLAGICAGSLASVTALGLECSIPMGIVTFSVDSREGDPEALVQKRILTSHPVLVTIDRAREVEAHLRRLSKASGFPFTHVLSCSAAKVGDQWRPASEIVQVLNPRC